jgi:hypothetical protein
MSSVWRLGNRNLRDLYLGEEHVGMLIDPELAVLIVRTMNGEIAELGVLDPECDAPSDPARVTDADLEPNGGGQVSGSCATEGDPWRQVVAAPTPDSPKPAQERSGPCRYPECECDSDVPCGVTSPTWAEERP